MADRPRHFRDLFEPASQGRYIIWRILGSRNPVSLKFRTGIHITLRSKATTDYGTAWDIFWRGCYRSPEPLGEVRRIVDLGANVGYSCLFWCHEYPAAIVTTFEPHPEHVKAVRAHLNANRIAARVEVVEAAAGVADANRYLVDAGSSSCIVETSQGFPVHVVNLFDRVKGAVDLMKIDIEGGEYSILADDRFPTLGARTVVVEWHRTDEHPDGREWCESRLKAFGYRTRAGVEDLPIAGLIWAFRDS